MADTPGVAVDWCHADLIAGIVRALKPARVLEFGFGAGRSAEAILRGLQVNNAPSLYHLVDSWADWGGEAPADFKAFPFYAPNVAVGFSQMTERQFVHAAARSVEEPFDFIMSDADHHHTHEWFDCVYRGLLTPGGVLVYHDVCNADFPGLCALPDECRRRGLPHVVFDRSSQAHEACHRGLLVIFKPRG